MKTRLLLLFNVGLVVAGLLLVLYLVVLMAWQFNALFRAGSWVPLPASLLFTEFGWAAPKALAVILERLHVGVIFAVVGLFPIAFGALGVMRQVTIIRAEKQQREDRLRRVRDYRRDQLRMDAPDGRREPYIGPA